METPASSGGNVCLNCGTELKGPFCHTCGQKALPRQTLGDMISNFISSFWSFESKFFKTFGYVLFQPGRIALEYNQGKRERFYHPARMYVFVSFIYFLLSATLPPAEERSDATQLTAADSAQAGGLRMTLADSDYETRGQYDSAQAALPAPERDGWLMRKLSYRAIDLNLRYGGNQRNFNADVAEIFTANLPKVFFVMVPVLALLLWLFYRKKDYNYAEHLVTAVYFSNFVFTAASLMVLVAAVSWLQWAEILFELWILVYLLPALLRIHRQKPLLTVVKYAGIAVLFLVCLAFGLLANFFITLMLI
jgi:hypothetical protein